MGNDPAFLFYPGDYLRDTQCLSEKSQVAYDRIMCEHMRNIPVSQKRLNFFTKRLSEEEREEISSVLTEVGTEGGEFVIPWVSASIDKRRAYSESRRRNREKGLKSYVKDVLSHDPHMENENENEIVNESESEKEPEREGLLREKIVDLLNSVLGTKYRPHGEKMKSLIRARFNQGFVFNDFITVIEKKANEWQDDPKMQKYLRPETLFSNKFEGYLNQLTGAKPNDRPKTAREIQAEREYPEHFDPDELTVRLPTGKDVQ